MSLQKFSWGRVIQRHEIGLYEVIEYHPWKETSGPRTRPWPVDEEQTNFHGYIDGKDTHEAWLSLDEALVGMIVTRYVGLNAHSIAAHFMAGLKAMSRPSEGD